jgi:hypothetical protein
LGILHLLGNQPIPFNCLGWRIGDILELFIAQI